ncbi:hypothetical protein [Bacillus sp. Marseille-P3661]|uniref:hypothetical protein n=1 Tax=Bacillus sp. Marseille-P3661 TaxID=1936234 RepID=UPI000C81554A|nr:hypothetical protein [Bacillus sp. Marseille-P3661]
MYIYPNRYFRRQNNVLDKILACHSQNRWGRITFQDGTNIVAFLSTYDFFRGGLVYVPMGTYTITCNGISLDSVQKVQNCIGKTAMLTLPNNLRLSFTIDGTDQYESIGGWLNMNELLNMMSLVTDVTCI